MVYRVHVGQWQQACVEGEMTQVGVIKYRLRVTLKDATFNDIHYTNRESASKAFNLITVSGAPVSRIEMDKITIEPMRIWEPSK